MEISSSRVSVTIVDYASPFNPFSEAPPNTKQTMEDRPVGGLGIHLVRSMMDEVSYHRRIDRNVATLVKYIDPQA